MARKKAPLHCSILLKYLSKNSKVPGKVTLGKQIGADAVIGVSDVVVIDVTIVIDIPRFIRVVVIRGTQPPRGGSILTSI